MQMPRFEDAYLGELVSGVCKRISGFRRPPTFLCLGGGQWRFAKLVATEAKVEKVFYADNDHQEKDLAEKAGLWVVQCDPADTEELLSASRYDIVLMKNTLENIAARITNLDEYLVALYKVIKLRGLVVLVSRLRPSLPLPKRVLDKWAAVVPSEEALKAAVVETGLGIECELQKVAYDCNTTKKDWTQVLKCKKLAFCDDLTDAEIKEALDKYKTEKINFKDEICTIVIRKKIERMKRDESGMIIDDGLMMGFVDDEPAAKAKK